MKSEEKQRFTSFDFFTMAASLTVIVVVSLPIIKRNFQSDESLATVKRDLGVIGQSVRSPQALSVLAMNAAARSAGDRNIASVGKTTTNPSGNLSLPDLDLGAVREHLKKGEWEGEIGKDPWGSPYHFSFVHNQSGAPHAVAVWSDGPNKTNDTPHGPEDVVDDPAKLKFKGDDIGAIIPIR